MEKMNVYKEQISYLLFLFFAGSFIGFIWEVIVHLFQSSDGFIKTILYYRGFLFGPWVPIYGVGIVLIYLLTLKAKKSGAITFIYIASICSIVEYLASWILEKFLNVKFWDYSSIPMNLNGRICLLSVIFFGLAGVAIIYLFEPTLKKVYFRINNRMSSIACIILSSLFVFDFICSFVSIIKL